MEENNIGQLVRQLEQNYVDSPTTISKYVEFNQYETINTIEAYLNSKHISGSVDNLGREKPFFNIVTAVANIWHRATDIDRKNIKVKATRSKDIIASYFATIKLQEFMRKSNFGAFLNDLGRTLSRYGSAVTKFVEKDGELVVKVIPWNRLIVDPVDFNAAPVIEILELTTQQLRENPAYDKEMVEGLIESTESRKTLDGTNKDNRPNFIRVYEVHGYLPLEWVTGKESDSETYVQQMQVLAFTSKSKGRRKDYEDFVLYKGREKKNPYHIAHLIKEDGRTLAIGAVESLFDAQWMVNSSVKAMKDQLDLASKLIFQTSDASFIGQNALLNIESGDILTHSPNEPLTQLNNGSHDLTSLQNYALMWKNLSQEITNTPDSLRGNSAPSGTAWRQVEAIQQEANSLFELMTENKGLAIEEMLREYVIPFIKRGLDNQDEIRASFELADLQKIDEMYIRNEAIRRSNRKIIDTILSGGVAEPADLQTEQQNIQNELADLGNQRFYSPGDISWKELLKDIEWDLEIDITGEQSSTQNDLATLNTVFQIIASNPQILSTKNGKLIFNKILEKTGAISPAELSMQPEPQQPQAQVNPQTTPQIPSVQPMPS